MLYLPPCGLYELLSWGRWTGGETYGVALHDTNDVVAGLVGEGNVGVSRAVSDYPFWSAGCRLTRRRPLWLDCCLRLLYVCNELERRCMFKQEYR